MAFDASRLRNHWLILVAGVLLAAVAAQAQIPITQCGTTISSPGRYVLANDLLNCPGNGVQIRVTREDGITELNLASHQITGVGRTNGTGILVTLQEGQQNVVYVIGAGTISNFGTCLETRYVGIVEVDFVTCDRNGRGFAFGQGSDVLARENGASDNGTSTGSGFEIASSEGTFVHNLANGNAAYGFSILGSRNHLEGNTALQNFRYGIGTSGVQNTIIRNTALRNALYDLYEGGSDCVNRWEDNTFSYANMSCIH